MDYPHPKSFEQFWPYYVAEHSTVGCRVLHYIGTTAVIALSVVAAVTGDLRWLIGLPLAGYGCAWIGHFFVERNRPATFRHPLWSLISDFRMYGFFLTGRMGREVERVLALEQASPRDATESTLEPAAR